MTIVSHSRYENLKLGDVVEKRTPVEEKSVLGQTLRSMFGEGANITVSRILFDKGGNFLSESQYVLGSDGRIEITPEDVMFKGVNKLDEKNFSDIVSLKDISKIGLDGTNLGDSQRLSFVEDYGSENTFVVSIIKNSDSEQ